MQPLSDNILVKPLDQSRIHHGIHIPGSAEKQEFRAQVIGVGPGKKDQNNKLSQMHVQKDDIIGYHPYNGTHVEINKEKFLILKNEEVLYIYE